VFFAQPTTITVNKRRVDRNGDWVVVSSFQVSGCAISLASKARAYEYQTFEQDTVRGISILFAPSGTDIETDDTVTLDDGTTWHVWGIPTDYQSPFTGWQPGLQVQLRYFAG